MIEDNIDERRLGDIVDVVLIYGLPKILEDKEKPGSNERTLRAYQQKFPKVPSNLVHATIEIINKLKLDEVFEHVLIDIPAAIELSKEYKSKPDDK